MSLWNYTIDDASPYLTYTPYGDSVANGGWRTWYTGSQYATSHDETTQGNSFHIASSSANVTFQFFGTNLALYGFTNSSFNVIIDNEPPTTVNIQASEDSLLYSSDTLTNRLHSVTLSAQPNLTQSLAFDSAIVSVSLDDNEGSPSPTFYDSTNTTLFTYLGDWASQTQNGIPNSTVTAPFHETTQINASVSFAFSGAKAVVVKGLVTSENGMYSVSLDGQKSVYNGTSLWTLPDALLYFRAGLDPTITHELNITNLSSKLCLNSITVFQYEARNAAPPVTKSTSTPHHSTSIGIIVGPVIAACILLLAALGLFFWLRRRRGSLRPLYLKRKSSQDRTPVPARPPTSLISPMLATLNQGDRSITDVQSAFTGVGSDVHSSTNLLKNSPGYGQRSLRSNTSSDAALSQVSQRTEMEAFGYWDHRIVPSVAGSSASGSLHGGIPRHMQSFRSWESGSDVQALPLMSSQASTSTGHRSGPSLDAISQLSSGTHRTAGNLTIETSYTSASESTSPRRRAPGPGPSYIRMSSTTSSRGPLPNIPVPSYDAALNAPEVTPDEVKDMASLQFSEDSEYYPNPRRYSALTSITAPPQYER